MKQENSPEAILTTEKLVAGYGETKIIDEISVKFYRGKINALIGTNGAGCSTLLKAIAGIIPVISGKILFEGKKLTGTQEERYKKGICFVPEKKAIFEHLTVKENLELVGRKKNYDEIFALFPDLKKKWKLPAWKLSGGQKQMIAISQGILSDKKLLLIDNPVKGLYKKIAEDLLLFLKRLAKSKNAAIVVKADRIDTVERIAGSFYFLNAGKIIKGGDNAC